ncbi:transposase [Rhizobium mesoamericanum]|nr:transposase [Rhizobium mesoamericanum]
MTRRRYELMDHEWSIISPLLLPNSSAASILSTTGES